MITLTGPIRAVLISSILTSLEQGIRHKNQRLVQQCRHSEQEAFDRGDTFFQLTFLTDKNLRKVADLAL